MRKRIKYRWICSRTLSNYRPMARIGMHLKFMPSSRLGYGNNSKFAVGILIKDATLVTIVQVIFFQNSMFI